jgi:hypothetical protein
MKARRAIAYVCRMDDEVVELHEAIEIHSPWIGLEEDRQCPKAGFKRAIECSLPRRV